MKKIPKLAKCPKRNEMCNRIHNVSAVLAHSCQVAPCTKSGFGYGFRDSGTDWGLLWYFVLFLCFSFGSFSEYCGKRPTNNHLQAAKLHNRPGRISIFFLGSSGGNCCHYLLKE